MVGVHTVPGGVDVRQGGAHPPVDRDGIAHAQLRPGIGGERGVGAHAGDEQDHIAVMAAGVGVHVQAAVVGGDG